LSPCWMRKPPEMAACCGAARAEEAVWLWMHAQCTTKRRGLRQEGAQGHAAAGTGGGEEDEDDDAEDDDDDAEGRAAGSGWRALTSRNVSRRVRSTSTRQAIQKELAGRSSF